MTVHDGDQIEVEIMEVGSGQWQISIAGSTTNGFFQHTFNFVTDMKSEDFIEERPMVKG